ncbi:helix-turn-helix transcriptional regulator [Chitinophaga sp. Cy-1792]|uniref:helix-turn-helix domain-containing protein n=1 Tax=Chitinophaga sp. Cy-1792 TaxID=2608339 RepID=UPI00141F02E5
MDIKDTILAITGKSIRQLRKARGWTLEDLGDAAEVDPSKLSKIERGLINAEYTTIVKIAIALGVQLNNVFVIPYSKENAK